MTDSSRGKYTSNTELQKFWQSHLDKWKRSGVRQAVYCRENNLKNRQFTYWKRKFLSDVIPVELVQVCTEPISIASVSSNSRASLHLTVNSSFVIEIRDGFSPSTLKQVLRTLQEV